MPEAMQTRFNWRKHGNAGLAPDAVSPDHCRLGIPTGSPGKYRLAQLDDYTGLSRDIFPWQPPLRLCLWARVSAEILPGTWGFGLWNDPFSVALGFVGGVRRLPMLPQAAWFFFASGQNYLSLRDELPAQGFLAQTFRSRQLPGWLLAGFASLGLPALAWRPLARRFRVGVRNWIVEDAARVPGDVCQWQRYSLTWYSERVCFQAGDWVFETPVAPRADLGLVIWIDNQYLAFDPQGRLAFGTLASDQPAWLEIEQLSVNRLAMACIA